MGFDIECIIDIQSYPGEYFCPVCRTLVYPNEALQAQCTHVYCKPCLAHIANGSRACPYDGYLVTESDSKPLMESDEALAEKIGKVKVHCLYFRSGCTWEGTLSDCASHGSGCSFGNSPVICNRCGIQIVHRQVHDHAQICPGVYDGQQPVAAASGSTKSGTTSSTVTAAANQTVVQSGHPVSHAQNTQNISATPLPGQNSNLQVNANSQTPVAAPAAVPAPEQWYQQQYQQHYQQYAGYDPYQQSQQYYALQQQPFQQYQQPQVQVQGQHQSYAYSQAGVQPQFQAPPQPQPQPQPQAMQQPYPVPQGPPQHHSQPQGQVQIQTQSQPQPQPQPQPQLLPQGQPQVQLPPQGQAQAHVPPNYQANPQQVPHPPMRPQTQIPPQALPPPPHSQSTQPAQHPQTIGIRPPAQHPQVPHYQQPLAQVHHSQASQAHVQPQMHPQTQSFMQSSNQSNVLIQPQPQPQLYQTQSQPPVFHASANQSATSAPMLHPPHTPVPPVSGHHSYQQPLPGQKMQSGAQQQPPVQVNSQISQQSQIMRPPQSHGSISQQQPTTNLAQSQTSVPHVPNLHFPSLGQQSTYPIQHRPLMQPVQQILPQNYPPQQLFSAPFQGQVNQQALPSQQPMQSQMQMRPSGPPHLQQSQNYIGTPIMPTQVIHPQSQPLSSGGFGPLAPSGPAQLATQTSVNQNYANPDLLGQNVTVQETRSPSKGLGEKGFEGGSLNGEVGAGQNETVLKDADSAAKDGLAKPVIKQETGDIKGALEQSSGGMSSEAANAADKFHKEEFRSLTDSVSMKQEDLDKQSPSAVPASSMDGHVFAQQSHDSQREGSQAQVQGKPPLKVGPGNPGQSLKLTEGKVPGNFGVPPKIFESQSGPQRSLEGLYVSQHAFRPSDIAMPRDRVSGSGDGGPLNKPHTDEQNFSRANGVIAPDSMFVSKDGSFFPREPTHPHEQASRSHDKPFHGPIYDAGSKLDPGALGPHSRFLPHSPGGHGHGDVFGPGPEFGQHHVNPFTHQSPGGDFLGSPPHGFGGPSGFPRGALGVDDFNSREAHRFGEGSRSNPSSDLAGNAFRDGRFPPLPGHLRRGDIDGTGNPRFSEHRPPALIHNQIRGDDVFGPDGPGHSVRGNFSGPGYLSGHLTMGESGGHGTFPGHGRAGGSAGNFPRPPFSDTMRGDKQGFLPFGDPAMRNNYPFHGFPDAGNYSLGVDSFDQSRKRKPLGTGWCRICEFDCETVEGLEMHSQTREHQNVAMDVVKSIKLQNRKKHRSSAGHMVHEGGNRSRKMGTTVRGNKA